MRLAAIALCAALAAGCSSLSGNYRSYAEWEASSVARAQAGEILWSQHYSLAYARSFSSPSMTAQADVMHQNSVMLQAARTYEQGGITKDEFEGLQRQAAVIRMRELQIEEAQASARRGAAAAAFAAGIQNVNSQYRYTPIAAPPAYVPPPRPINCLTQPSGNGLMTTCN